MNGMEIMLKSMGLDPEALKMQAETIGKLVENIASKLNEIEAQQTRMNAKLDALLAVNAIPAVVPAVAQISHEVNTHA